LIGKLMLVQTKQLAGNWDLGYALHKHTLSSVYLGDDANGHPQFETTRSEPGEALFQLKYRADFLQVPLLAVQLQQTILPMFQDVGLIIPMPPSTVRARQPVVELAKELGRLAGIPVFDSMVVKTAGPEGAQPLKDLKTKAEKVAALAGRFTINQTITNEGQWNALLVDDLFDTGATMDAVCTALRTYPKIGRVYAATITWK
jgi:predicted amidophosphoribosyltransferase